MKKWSAGVFAPPPDRVKHQHGISDQILDIFGKLKNILFDPFFGNYFWEVKDISEWVCECVFGGSVFR